MMLNSIQTMIEKMFTGYGARFAKNRRGAVAIMTVLLLPVLLGCVGLAVDLGIWYAGSVSLTNAAQAAAMAGAMAEIDGITSPSALQNVAQQAGNMASSDLTGHPGLRLSVSSPGTVLVTATQTMPATVSILMNVGALTGAASAAATVQPTVAGMEVAAISK
jgi:Flp pilus assembly protein TadG